MIKPNQGAEQFLQELEMMAEVGGITCYTNYEERLKDRFCHGLSNATIYASLLWFSENFKTVGDVLRKLRKKELLNDVVRGDLTYKKKGSCSLTKNTQGLHHRFNKPGDKRNIKKDEHQTPKSTEKEIEILNNYPATT